MVKPVGAAAGATIGSAVGIAAALAPLVLGTLATFLRGDGGCLPRGGGGP